MRPHVSIVDSGAGNLGSVRNMLKKLGADSSVCRGPAELDGASRIILPGVGAFDNAMTFLDQAGMIPALNEAVQDRVVPVLGVCLGMQLLTRRSEEGKLPGLGWITADTVRFQLDPALGLKVPHMGWNELRPARSHPLLEGLDDSRYYFVHSYHVKCDSKDQVLATAQHGYEFTAAVIRGNVAGTQFHPEKSHQFGMKLLRNFLTWDPAHAPA